jgi:hypothetical protein
MEEEGNMLCLSLVVVQIMGVLAVHDGFDVEMMQAQ